MRKENSSNSINEKKINATCSTAYTLSLIDGRWKPNILWQLMQGKMRYNELKKSIPDVSERILTMQLRELENDGLVTRIIYAEVPPRVEYEMSEKGLSMKGLLQLISDWGDQNRG